MKKTLTAWMFMFAIVVGGIGVVGLTGLEQALKARHKALTKKSMKKTKRLAKRNFPKSSRAVMTVVAVMKKVVMAKSSR